MRIRMAIIDVLLLAITGWAAYAQAPVAGPVAPAALQPSLTWVEAVKGKPLFTVADVVRFDWQRQIVELTPECAERLMALPLSQRLPFAVKDADGVIYRGAFSRPTFIHPFDGPSIVLGMTGKRPAPPFFCIDGGFPTGGGARDADRFAPRLQADLLAAGVLFPINDAELPVQTVLTGYVHLGDEHATKAMVALFPDTLRLGQDAVLHILLRKEAGEALATLPGDQLTVTAAYTGNDGAYISAQQVLKISAPLSETGVYLAKLHLVDPDLAAIPAFTPVAPAADNITPSYPKTAQEEGQEGTVVLSILVKADGTLGGVTIAHSSGQAVLDQAAMRAVVGWHFTPAKAKGAAVDATVSYQFAFAGGKVEGKDITPPPPPPAPAPAQFVSTAPVLKVKTGPSELAFTFLVTKHGADGDATVGEWRLPAWKLSVLGEAGK